MDLTVRQAPAMQEPPVREPFIDAVFGTRIVRVTDTLTDKSADDVSGGMKNEYSRIEAFNSDGTKFIIRGTAGTWYLYDAATLRPDKRLPIVIDPRWSATDPGVIYFFDETRLMSVNVRTDEVKPVHEFAGDFPGQALAAVWTRYEGSPSLDGRYWGLMAEDKDWHTVALLVYDLKEDAVIARRDLRGVPNADADSVTISPLGNYVVAQDEYLPAGQLGNDTYPGGLMVYDRDLEHGRGLVRIIGHSDLALDRDGREVMVFQDIDNDTISMVDLATGNVTRLMPIDFSHTALGFHFSGLGTKTPGWAIVSTHNGGKPSSQTWMDDSVFAIELIPDGRIVRLAHTYSVYNENVEHDYWAEPQGSASRDMTRILFTSNWGKTGTDEVEAYMIVLPENWLDFLPAG
jgi:hypothetical protein